MANVSGRLSIFLGALGKQSNWISGRNSAGKNQRRNVVRCNLSLQYCEPLIGQITDKSNFDRTVYGHVPGTEQMAEGARVSRHRSGLTLENLHCAIAHFFVPGEITEVK